MNSILKLTIIVLIFFGFSCKDNKQTSNKDSETTKPQPKKIKQKFFSVKLKGIFEKADVIELYYLQDENEIYSDKQLLKEKVNASNEMQEVYFKMEEGIPPYTIRLDLGVNKDQTSIKIEECVLKYGDNSFVIKGNELTKYFIFNDGIEIQPDSLTFKLKPLKYQNKEVHDPYMKANKKLNDILLLEL